jgi:L-threonylcarbamoyladenylate synthase
MRPELEQAVQILRAGGIVAFPTETVYGLGADATNASAVRKIFEVKGRPATNPLIVHVFDDTVAKRYARDWPLAASQIAERFWPGPITIVLPKAESIVDQVTAGLDTVGLRVPNHPLALELLKQFDGALAGPSANKSSHVSPTNAQHVRDEFGDSIDLILDGGPCVVGIESTVLDLSHTNPTILRPGGISHEQIEKVIGPVEVKAVFAQATTPGRSPGQHAKHYAPRTPAFRFETAQRTLIKPNAPDGKPNGSILLGNTEDVRKNAARVTMPQRAEDYATHFYMVLRELDKMNLSSIFIEMPPDRPEWTAVRDRIMRATKPLPAD